MCFENSGLCPVQWQVSDPLKIRTSRLNQDIWQLYLWYLDDFKCVVQKNRVLQIFLTEFFTSFNPRKKLGTLPLNIHKETINSCQIAILENHYFRTVIMWLNKANISIRKQWYSKIRLDRSWAKLLCLHFKKVFHWIAEIKTFSL